MGKATLIIMAAGIGSRFGGGIKQLESVGPDGEIIMDYSIYDAMAAGFDKVVFVIRRDLEKEFKKVIGRRIEKIVDVDYAYQELEDIPAEFRGKIKNRVKPWGTGQAILCCRDIVNDPFLIINADDYYGKEAFIKSFDYLCREKEEFDKKQMCMIGFILKNTLSDNGGVTRGICSVGENGLLKTVVETHNIERRKNKAVISKEGREEEIDIESIVSMNMWGGFPDFFSTLEDGFSKFLDALDENKLEGEYLLPTIIGEQVEQNRIEVEVLQSSDEWFGVTYKEDKETVVAAIRELIAEGIYPERLYVQ
ncbi:sugar phosphate nucleotidyltransferase [[Clostridium] hylemonae]|uniref:sugar phosphate nucleotidyltransferase n=1 Tax=[Clostridium] hylemonae TaxID=89153 RepID=UPI001105E7EA|nr:sugar phosphate nucleotidyltransferase [[Clostridium] hylemonae]